MNTTDDRELRLEGSSLISDCSCKCGTILAIDPFFEGKIEVSVGYRGHRAVRGIKRLLRRDEYGAFASVIVDPGDLQLMVDAARRAIDG